MNTKQKNEINLRQVGFEPLSQQSLAAKVKQEKTLSTKG